MKSFNDIYEIACLHKGGAKNVESALPKALSDRSLKNKDDSFYLSNMTRRIFRAGLKHAMVDGKWPEFEKAFNDFDPFFCAMLSDDDIDAAMKNKSIIRHRGKLLSIRKNAQFVIDKSRAYKSFGGYLASWPPEKTVELWWDLKKKAAQMGGHSGSAFLRMVGKDTFLFTRDTVAVLKNEGVIDKEPSAKRDMLAAEAAFLQWQDECKRPLCEISRIVSFTATV